MIRIPPQPPAVGGIVVAVVIVDEPKVRVIELATPLDGLGDISLCSYCTVRRIPINRPYVTLLSIYLADVLHQIPVDSKLNLSSSPFGRVLRTRPIPLRTSGAFTSMVVGIAQTALIDIWSSPPCAVRRLASYTTALCVRAHHEQVGRIYAKTIP